MARERSAVVPLTATQQRNIAREEFTKAKLILDEAIAVNKLGKAPGACVSSAYYALEHAACAAILLFGGVGAKKDFPKSHRDIMLHFGRLSASDKDLSRFGSVLSQIYGLREIADYSVQLHPSRADAEIAVASALEFLAACSRKWKSKIDLEN